MIQAWHIYELDEDGTKIHLDTIRTADAEQRAQQRCFEIWAKEGRVVYAEPFDGPFTEHR